jgi:hypothetical protein
MRSISPSNDDRGDRESTMNMRMGLMSLALLAFAAPATAEDAPAINAFAMWQGQGQIIEIGPSRIALIGAFGGPLFIETSEGPAEAGTITCPLLLQIETTTGKQAGTGSCVFTANDGARAFGDWDCVGVHLVGCRGVFNLTGGTGRLEGVTGTSTILFRGRPERLRAQVGMIGADSIGIAVWRDLKITGGKTPAKP